MASIVDVRRGRLVAARVQALGATDAPRGLWLDAGAPVLAQQWTFPVGFVSDTVLGVYLHGLLEDPDFVSRMFGAAPPRSLETVLDELADAVAPHLDINRLEERIA